MRKIQMITSDALLVAIGFFVGNIIPKMKTFSVFTVVLAAFVIAILSFDEKMDKQNKCGQNEEAKRKLRRVS